MHHSASATLQRQLNLQWSLGPVGLHPLWNALQLLWSAPTWPKPSLTTLSESSLSTLNRIVLSCSSTAGATGHTLFVLSFVTCHRSTSSGIFPGICFFCFLLLLHFCLVASLVRSCGAFPCHGCTFCMGWLQLDGVVNGLSLSPGAMCQRVRQSPTKQQVS